jgi:ubiquinone/menaquinone biosynthesis C-methylase UbiE
MNEAAAVKRTYDRIGGSFERNVKSDSLDKKYIEKFLGYLKPGQLVLDAGSGTGSVAAEMTEKYRLRVVAIDVSRKMKNIAKKHFPGIDYRLMDLRRLKFPNGYFDAVFAMYSLIHVREEEVPDALAGFYRVLKPGGWLYLALQEPVNQKQQDRRYPVVYRKDAKLFINVFRRTEIVQYLRDAGFEIISSSRRLPDRKTEFPFKKLFIIAKRSEQNDDQESKSKRR